MKTLVAFGAALLLSAGVLTGSAAFAQGSWPHDGSGPHSDGPAQHSDGSWQRSNGPQEQSSPSWQPHSSPSWQQHSSESWPHPSGSFPHPSSSGSWNHDHDHDDHHGDHRRHRWGGGPPFYGWGPVPGYDDYDYGYDDEYYPSYQAADDDAHVRWCQAHYRTYNPATDIFFVRRGVPAKCVAPFDRPYQP